jgi:hypothetical protein
MRAVPANKKSCQVRKESLTAILASSAYE